jgi:hypothetical protein
MQNYYDTQKKLELDRRGLKLLYDQKAELRATVEPKSVVTDKVMIVPWKLRRIKRGASMWITVRK